VAIAVLRTTPCDAAPTVQYADGRITVDLRDDDLADVLGEIAKHARLEMRGTPTAQRLSVRLDAVPLVDALSRLLQGQSFALTYDNAGGVKGVRFLGSSTASWAGPRPDTAASTPAAEPSTSQPAIDRPIHIDGLLASAIGAEDAKFSTILAVATQSGDARVRADALRAGLGALDAEPDLNADVLQWLAALDDAALADKLTEVALDHAEEVAQQTARLARSGSLRRRAAAVLRLLRSSGPR
jgi:hypothetical protein